jgi:hypothetical protein
MMMEVWVAMLFGQVRPLGVFTTAKLAAAALRKHPDFRSEAAPGESGSYLLAYTLDGGPVLEPL